jgi:DNA polymerase-3 subunit epsilon|tara:strand:+ start:528 stop:1154 length:627 start_codon:yes stop_codon:yes gene_type:complete
MIPQISLDFETSGLNPYHDDIIEVAMKVVGKDETFTALLKPKSNECISEEITHLTGITNKMLHIDGLPWSEVYQGMDKWLKNVKNSSPSKKIAIIAHNGDGFDFIFLKRLFNDLSLQGIKPINVKDIIFIDTLPFAKRSLPKRMSYRQESLCKTYKIITDGNHRALNDVVALEQLYGLLGKKLTQQLGKRRCVSDDPHVIYDYIHCRI